MKKMFKTVAALALVMFAGCTTDMTNDVVAPIDGKTTVTVGIDDTRTHLGELVEGVRKVYWSNGDQIAVNGVVSQALALEATDVTAAAFAFEGTLEYPYSVLYPAKAYVDVQTINLPAHQGRGLENVDNNVLPMATYAAAGEPAVLHHLAGAVKYQISCGDKTTDMHSIRRLEVWGNNNEQMAGDFVIDYQSATLTAAGTNAESKVVVEIDKDQNESGIVTVYAVLPAIEYTNGITVRLIDKAGHYMDLASTPMTIEKGEIKAMPAVEFVPTGTIIDTEILIASAAEWNAFVKEYNADKYEGAVVSVKFTQDIVFDDATNAEFETIKASNGYFAGVVDGQNFSIKGLKSVNKPIFNSISGSVLKNIVVDASCEWTYTDISLDANTWFGTLAVDIFSTTAENITMKANTTFNNITSEGNGLTVYTGNIFGRTNAQCVVKNCVNDGAVETLNTCNFGLTSSDGIPSATVYTGGIVGYSRCPMENCTNNGAITSDWNAHTKAIGGIVGRITGTGALVNCVNTGAITNNSRRKPAAPLNINDYNRYIYLGGVVGLPACNVSNCSNSGTVTSASNVKAVYVGGVISYSNSDVGVYNNLTNTGEVSTTGDARYPYVGGILGYCKTPYLTNISNEGAISVGRTEASDTVVGGVGGIVGQLIVSLDGTNTITNSGAVSFTNANVGWNYVGVGGIAGLLDVANGTLSKVKNTGVVTATAPSGKLYYNLHVGGIVGLAVKSATVTDTTHEGGVCFYTNQSNELHYNICVGGIVGSHIDGQTLTVTNSENKGYAAVVGNATGVYQAIALGGIAGALVGGDSSISNCTVTGRVGNSRQNNNTTTFTIRASGGGATQIGGIAGYVEGTADNLISVTNCSFNNNGNLENFVINTSYAIYALRGVVGGLVGTAKYADIKQNTCVARLYLTNTTMLAGLVGYLQNSNLEECSLVNTEVLTKSANGSGGLVAKSVASTVKNNIINNTSVTTTGTATNHGLLAGISDADSSFTDNKVNGTFQGAAITLESVMVANGAPTVTGTALYTE